MAKAQKLPSGKWRCQAVHVDEDGIRHRASFVEETAVLAEAKIAMWKAGMIERSASNGLALNLAMDEYIASCRVANRSASTIRGYVSMRENAFDLLENKKINKLTLRDLQRWINTRAQSVSPKTLRNNLNFLSAVLTSNGIKMDLDALKMPDSNRVEMEIPSDAQVSALLDMVRDDDDLFIACSLAALMGLRRSEICGLRWSDIRLTDNTAALVVDKALVMDEHGLCVEKATKTAAGKRTLPIPADLYAELKRRRHLRPTLVSASPNALSNRYAIRAEKLGMPTRFHNLRHYHASVMLREGATEKYIIADMGHASFDMVKRVYGHVMPEKQGVIDAAMDAHASTILRPTNDSTHESTHAL